MHHPDPASTDGAPDLTYTGGKLERAFLLESLRDFFDDQLITDVLYKVKGGKEANVYCCAAHPDTGVGLLAAKVYRPEAFRAMKNDGLYRLGREEVSADGKAIRDKRALRAMHKRTKTGRAMRSASWLQHEYRTLCDLFDAGADVPEPISLNEHTIVMKFVGDASRAAPTLHEVGLNHGEARQLFDDLIRNVALMLDTHRIHGDLSPYNVLYDAGRAVVIDLPQCVDPHTHPQAYALLTRDVERLCTYFARQGVDRDPHLVTADLWQRCVRR
ncbi:MAG: RIO1 family regulatory kinase/ATPase [Planctomycetota bacterium]